LKDTSSKANGSLVSAPPETAARIEELGGKEENDSSPGLQTGQELRVTMFYSLLKNIIPLGVQFFQTNWDEC
jgi:hypothetical protein